MSSAKTPLCVVLGYDPVLVRELSLGQQRALDALSQAWLMAAAVLAYPLGVVIWMIEHSWLLALATAAGVFVFTVNLLRLLTAGSGVAPELAWSPSYRPSLLPVAIFFAFALIMSQPAQLLHAGDEARARVELHRAELIASHRASAQQGTRRAGSGVVSHADDAFLRKLRECEFVVLRLKLLWTSPEAAVTWTALYLLVVLTPTLLARSLWLPAVRAYERQRHQRTRREVRVVVLQTRRQVLDALSRYPSFRSSARKRVGPPLTTPSDVKQEPA